MCYCHLSFPLAFPNQFYSVHLNEMMRTTGEIKLSTMNVTREGGREEENAGFPTQDTPNGR